MILSIKKILIQIIYVQIGDKSWKNILIHYIGYVTMKKDSKKYSINHFYFILGNVSGYFEEINGNKYLTLVLTNKSKIIKNKNILGIMD